MKPIKLLMSAAIFGLAFAVPAFAQTGSPSASQSMHQAGQEMKEAGSDTWNAAKDVGEGTKTAVHDTTITAKVKNALHGDQMTKDQKIHVSTTAGVVTLKGKVATVGALARAQQIAQGTKGVKSVNNQLAVAASSSSDM
jgi:hyperosmotically inducible protein